MTTTNFSWLCYKKETGKKSILDNILPVEYSYKISSFKVIHESEIPNETKFEAAVAVNICSGEALFKYLIAFSRFIFD